jgi:hypothetical protein
MRALLLPGLIAIVATSAVAQETMSTADTGSRIKTYRPAEPYGSSKLLTAASARATGNAFGECMMRYRPAQMKQLVSMVPGTAAAQALADRVATNECLDEGRLQFTEQLLRGAVFIAMYKRDFANSEPTLSPVPIDFAAEAKGAPEAIANSYIGSRQFAECVVREAPVASRKATLSIVGSPEEAAVYNELKPALSKCITQGAQVEMTKSALSKLIAEVLYRLSAIGTPKAITVGAG